MMKLFLKQALLLFSILFIIDKGACFLLDKAESLEYDTRLTSVLKGQINKDLIVIGSSRGSGNIIASQLEQETGYMCYNLSYQGANILYQEFILKTLLKYNKAPKKLIIAIDNPYTFRNETSLHFRTDRLFPLSKNNYINDVLITQGERSRASKYFYLLRVSGSMFRMKTVNPPRLDPFEACGSRPIVLESKKDLVFDDIKTAYSKDLEAQSHIQAFKRIQALCQFNSIDVTFVFPPNFQVFNSGFYNRFNTLVLPENKVFVYDTLNPNYKNKKYFYDASHLTKSGASLFTSDLSVFINQNKTD